MAQWPPLMRGHPFWEATFTQHLGWLLVRGFTVLTKMVIYVIRKKEMASAGLRSLWKTKQYFILENM